MHEAGLVLAASQVESLIGTVASSLGNVVNSVNPIVEGELLIGAIRFEGLLPPVSRKPCCVMRKPAQVLYTLDDYVRDEILSHAHAGILREAVDSRCSVVIAGGTGSGKTTLVNAVLAEIDDGSQDAMAAKAGASSASGPKATRPTAPRWP